MAAELVAQIMSPTPVALPADTPLTQAAQLMRQHGIGDVLVTDRHRLHGLVTDRDIVVRAVATGRDTTHTTLADICSTNLITVRGEDPVDTAITLMRTHGIRRIPVVDGARPIGILSLGDLAIQRDHHSALAAISAKPATT